MQYHRPLTRSLIAISLILVSCSARHLIVTSHHEQQYIIKKEDATDTAMIAMLKPYKRGVDTQMQVIIGHTDIPLTKAQPESTIGNFVADATLTAAQKIDPKVVAAVSNYWGIRLNYLAPGHISRGKIYELMPFDNMLTIIEVPGKELLSFCDLMAVRKGWPVAGIVFTIKDQKATDVKIGGETVNPGLVYKIAMSDFTARGGENCDMLIPLRKHYTTVFLRDALIEYIAGLERSGKPLHPVLEKRIQYAE